MTAEEAIETIKTAMAEVEWEYPMDYTVAFDRAIKALETIEQVKHEIKESKKVLSDPATVVNQDYRTGYLCGLSFVEGLIAELEGLLRR